MTVLSALQGVTAAVTAVVLTALGAAAQPLAPVPAARLAVLAHVDAVDSRWDLAAGTIVTYVDVDGRARSCTAGRPIGSSSNSSADASAPSGCSSPVRPASRSAKTRSCCSRPARATARSTPPAWAGASSPPTRRRSRRSQAALAATPVSDAPYVPVPAEAAGRADAPAFAYLPTDGGYPARWHEVDDDGVVFVDHPSALPGTWTGSTANATAAINLWRNSGMELDLRDGGASLAAGSCAATFSGNGRIGVSYNDPCGVDDGQADNWVIGGGYYTTGDLRTVNGTTFQKFIQGFVVLNNVGPQSGSAACFQDAITHGLGHALGLGHSDSGGAMMNALPALWRQPARAGRRRRQRHHRHLSRHRQRSVPARGADGADRVGVAVDRDPGVDAGHDRRAGAAPSRGRRQPQSGVYNVGSILLPTATPGATFSGVPPGTYFVRVRAQNAAGTSGPSPEAQVTVGACAAPGAPGPLTAAASDTTVNLAWSAPAAGVTQGYRLIVGSAPGLANVLVQDYPATVTALTASGVPYGTYYVSASRRPTPAASVRHRNEVTVVVQPCAAPPQAPTGLTFSRSGTFVALAWTPPASGPAPSSYTLVVGSADRRQRCARHVDRHAATSIGAAAPPGTYFARILAQNACGMSGPSNEIVVVVP